MFPKKLQPGDEVRVIAPANSLAIIREDCRMIAKQRFAQLGLELSFGQHVEEIDEFDSSSIESRVADLHQAFSDKNVKAIFSVIGGFNSNQLLRYLDWDLIKSNPKIFCGYSDTTAISDALYAKTGLVNYYGPSYSSFGQKLYFDYTLEYMKKCLLDSETFVLEPSQQWSDDVWYLDQQNRKLITNEGPWIINEGLAEGIILGGNLCTFNLLQGTEYFPDLTDSILFLEDDEIVFPEIFDRDLQSLIHLPDFSGVKGLAIGRFQKASNMTKEKLIRIIKTKKELNHLPVVANLDFGHTDPQFTFPIGGISQIDSANNHFQLKIIKF
ncbi:MAG: LD-carboxypeptidase [Candidatus Komeilibacteria bacterium]|nr:LD-carboxypeptidase [Candidatus Komeilibacteria bacterium]